MKAMLVSISPMVRVVVADNATESQIIEAAKRKMFATVSEDFESHVDEIKDDTEVPYGQGYNDVKELSQEEHNALALLR